MEPLYTGVLIVDHKFHRSTRRFAVDTPYDARIEGLEAEGSGEEARAFLLYTVRPYCVEDEGRHDHQKINAPKVVGATWQN